MPASATPLEKISGCKGFIVFADTSAHTSLTLDSLVINADAVISAFEIDNVNVLSAKGLTGVTLKQGMYLPTDPDKKITKVTLTSGSVIGYY